VIISFDQNTLLLKRTAWYGSSNVSVIYVHESYLASTVVLYFVNRTSWLI